MAGSPQKDWPNVRLRPDLNQEIDEISRKTGISRVGLVGEAVERYLRRRKRGDAWENKDPAVTPAGPEETEFVRMVLDIARNPFDRAEESTLRLLHELYLQRTKK